LSFLFVFIKLCLPNLLLGERGSGKSFTLNQAVLHARKKGWLCLFIPKGWEQVQTGSFVEPVITDDFERNPIVFEDISEEEVDTNSLKAAEQEEKILTMAPADEHTVFDNQEKSAEALRGFYRAHAEQLRSVPIANPAALQKYDVYRQQFMDRLSNAVSMQENYDDIPFIQLRALAMGEDTFPELDALDQDILADFKISSFKLETLEDLVLLGIAMRFLSGSIFIDLVAEMRELNVPEMPVLFAVDQYNAWDVNSAFAYDNKVLLGKRLAVPHALNFLSPKKADSAHFKVKNGMCIGKKTCFWRSSHVCFVFVFCVLISDSICIRRVVGATSQRHTEGKKMTYDQYRRSFPLTVVVPNYSAVEYLAAGAMFSKKGNFPDNLLSQDFLGLRMYCGSNPRLFRLQSQAFLLPRIIVYGDDKVGEEARIVEEASARRQKEAEEGERFKRELHQRKTAQEEEAKLTAIIDAMLRSS
jgi:hypothetical protein